MKKSNLRLMVCGAVLLAAAGCGKSATSDETGPGPVAVPEAVAEPVTLKVLQYSADITDSEFQTYLAEPVKKKYPHITLQLVRSQPNFSLEDMIASGDFPDLVYTGSKQIDRFIELGVLADLTETIAKNKIDLNAFNSTAIDNIRGNRGKMYALPISMNFSAMFYNKDIFDKFGVSYPTDNMTWEQVIELGSKVARTDGGVTYKPVSTSFAINFAAPYQTVNVDPQTDKALLNTEAMKKAVALLKRVTDLPGNQTSINNNRPVFEKERTLAMLPDFGEVLGELIDLDKNGNPLNWDVVSYPSMPDAPNKGFELIAFLMMVSANTKHPDEAGRVLQVITSADNQLNITRNGRLSSLKDPKYSQEFTANVPQTKGKNIQGIFKSSPSPSPVKSKYENVANAALNKYVQRVVKNEMDINSALAAAEEEANKNIAAQKGK